MSFPYKTVLITGATSGIGLALAEKMISSGTYVIAVGRRRDRLDALVAKHGANKVSAEPYDMMDLDGMEAWVKRITTQYPTLSAILLAAGLQRSVPFTSPHSISSSELQAEIATNYTAPLMLISLFLPHLLSLAPGPAAIIVVSSGLALLPAPGWANYCATKAALRSLAWSLRSQLQHGGTDTAHVRVVEVVPPAVRTELLMAQGASPFGMELAEFTEECWAGLVAGREEVAVGEMVIAQAEGQGERERRKAFEKFAEVLRAQGF